MKFQKGQSGNPKGRPPGSANKATGQVREALSDFILDKVESLEEIWEVLKPREKARLLVSVLKYVIPVQKEIEVNENPYANMSREEINERLMQSLKQLKQSGSPLMKALNE